MRAWVVVAGVAATLAAVVGGAPLAAAALPGANHCERASLGCTVAFWITVAQGDLIAPPTP